MTGPEAGEKGVVLRLHREGLFQLLIAAIAQVAFDGRVPPFAIHVLEDEPVFAGVWLLGVGNHAENFLRQYGQEIAPSKTQFSAKYIENAKNCVIRGSVIPVRVTREGKTNGENESTHGASAGP